MPKKTLVERLAETRALSATRQRDQERLSRARREAIQPRPPQVAINAYVATMGTFTGRVERLVEKLVLARLPVAGSGDLLDLEGLNRGLYELELSLQEMVPAVRRHAAVAGRRVSQHGRSEVARLMKAAVPDDSRADALVELFATRNVQYMRRVALAQVKKIRQAISEHEEGTSLRQKILDTLWVTRNRSRLVARDQCYKFHRETIRTWSVQAGSEYGVYVTRRDELVRHTHAAHDGKTYPWRSPPSTLMEPNCRCEMVPIEATVA